jgi:phosphoglucomutase
MVDRQRRDHHVPAGGEITAVTGKNPQEHYDRLAARFGAPKAVISSAGFGHFARKRRCHDCTVSSEIVQRQPASAASRSSRLTRRAGRRRIGWWSESDRQRLVRRTSVQVRKAFKIYCESFLGEARS